MPKLKNKDIYLIINKEFVKCKDFIANVMGYKTVEDTELIIFYDKYPIEGYKYPIEGWAIAEEREVAIVVPNLLSRNTFYIDYIIGHELGHILAYDNGCKGNTEGIAEVVGSYVLYSFSGSKAIKEDVIKNLAKISADRKIDREVRQEILRTEKELRAYDGDVLDFIKTMIIRKQIEDTKR